MQQFGFNQVANDPTTENATLIDHVYMKDIDIEKISVHIMPTYFSCHECVDLNFSSYIHLQGYRSKKKLLALSIERWAINLELCKGPMFNGTCT